MSPESEQLDPEQARGGLFLVSPPSLMPGFGEALDQVLANGIAVGFLLDLADLPATALEEAARQLQPVCRERTTALFLADLEMALQAGVDGALLPPGGDVAAARRRLGPDRLLGARCGLSRHAAMEAGEAGADFVAFGAADRAITPALLEVLDWWQGLFVLPVLAFAAIDDDRDLQDLCGAGADFLAVPWSLLERSGDLGAAMRRLRALTQ